MIRNECLCMQMEELGVWYEFSQTGDRDWGIDFICVFLDGIWKLKKNGNSSLLMFFSHITSRHQLCWNTQHTTVCQPSQKHHQQAYSQWGEWWHKWSKPKIITRRHVHCQWTQWLWSSKCTLNLLQSLWGPVMLVVMVYHMYHKKWSTVPWLRKSVVVLCWPCQQYAHTCTQSVKWSVTISEPWPKHLQVLSRSGDWNSSSFFFF